MCSIWFYVASGWYVHWRGYNVKLCRQSFKHQEIIIKGRNASWGAFYRLVLKGYMVSLMNYKKNRSGGMPKLLDKS
jgi:hypothetical protein